MLVLRSLALQARSHRQHKRAATGAAYLDQALRGKLRDRIPDRVPVGAVELHELGLAGKLGTGDQDPRLDILAETLGQPSVARRQRSGSAHARSVPGRK